MINELLSGVMPERDSTYDRAVDFLKIELVEAEQPTVLCTPLKPLRVSTPSSGVSTRLVFPSEEALRKALYLVTLIFIKNGLQDP